MITTKIKPKNKKINVNQNINNEDIIKFQKPVNYINLYITQMRKTNTDLLNPALSNDINVMLSGAAYYPEMACLNNDKRLFNNILSEIKDDPTFELIRWNQHYKIENPTISQTFNTLCNKMAEHLGIKIVKTRLNYYKDNSDWKTYHKDSHAYSEKLQIYEDYTFGISLGGKRILSFKHEQSGNILSFPQNNGDVFAFDTHVNQKFLHGVPKVAYQSEPRISVIVWGKKIEYGII